MTLYVVATPIGNLKDISERALSALREADLIAAEDTRTTVHLLTHFGIRKPMIVGLEKTPPLSYQLTVTYGTSPFSALNFPLRLKCGTAM